MLRKLPTNAKEFRKERESSFDAQLQGGVAGFLQLPLPGSDFLAPKPDELEHPSLPVKQLLGDWG